MTFLNGSRVVASSAWVLVLGVSCTASYTPELELWPAPPDGSSLATSGYDTSGYDAAVVYDAAGPAPIPTVGVYDGGWFAPPRTMEAGPLPQPPFGMDASLALPVDSGGGPVVASDSAPHQPPDAGPPRQHAATIVVTTIDDNQCYSPQNVGAIWIAQSSGAFVKTLQLWAKTRIDHLILWNSATKAAGLSRNTVDAITGATQQSFGTHVVYWNFTDTTQKVMPDGAYRVYFETTDVNGAGPNTFVNFTKGPTSGTFTGPDTPNFTDLKVVVTP
jgi:hypothetical protein